MSTAATLVGPLAVETTANLGAATATDGRKATSANRATRMTTHDTIPTTSATRGALVVQAASHSGEAATQGARTRAAIGEEEKGMKIRLTRVSIQCYLP